MIIITELFYSQSQKGMNQFPRIPQKCFIPLTTDEHSAAQILKKKENFRRKKIVNYF